MKSFQSSHPSEVIKDELVELNRRAEMKNNPSVCIPHEKVYDMVMTRVMEIK